LNNKDYKKWTVTIRGTKPLIFNNPASMNVPKGGKEVPVEAMLYLNKKGQLIQPALHVIQMIKDSAYKIHRKNGMLVNAYLEVEPEEIVHKNQNWEIFESQVVIDKSRITKKRPMLKEWELTFTVISLNPKELTGEIIREALDYAGTFNGLGDWSPRKGGRYGRFEVVRFEEQ